MPLVASRRVASQSCLHLHFCRAEDKEEDGTLPACRRTSVRGVRAQVAWMTRTCTGSLLPIRCTDVFPLRCVCAHLPARRALRSCPGAPPRLGSVPSACWCCRIRNCGWTMAYVAMPRRHFSLVMNLLDRLKTLTLKRLFYWLVQDRVQSGSEP